MSPNGVLIAADFGESVEQSAKVRCCGEDEALESATPLCRRQHVTRDPRLHRQNIRVGLKIGLTKKQKPRSAQTQATSAYGGVCWCDGTQQS